MNLLSRAMGHLRDSPTYHRDRATFISAPTIGITSLILNGMLLLTVLIWVDAPTARGGPMTLGVGFGQIVTFILLAGAAICATLLIPLRLLTTFWGPRVGGYFDQIVLSGISPLRYAIGRVASQNLLLGLILFLSLPWIVLGFAQGGVDAEYLICGLLLVWLYCMTLAIVTLTLSLYVNEALAALLTIVVAGLLLFFGMLPVPYQPLIMTPLPALMSPFYSSLGVGWSVSPVSGGYLGLVAASVGCSLVLIGVCLLFVYLGPLYGLISDNSTFGQVVCPGDNRRKRRWRMRLHIQRPSELAFFYENRGATLRRWEGLIRWGVSFLALCLLGAGGFLAVSYSLPLTTLAAQTPLAAYRIEEFHILRLMCQAAVLAGAVVTFSHARNTVYQQINIVPGCRLRVGTADTVAFLLFTGLLTTASGMLPYVLDEYWARPLGTTLLPEHVPNTMFWPGVVLWGTLTISAGGIVWYVLHRSICLAVWLRATALLVSSVTYLIAAVVGPMSLAAILLEFRDLQFWLGLSPESTQTMAIQISSLSPVTVMSWVFDERVFRGISVFDSRWSCAAWHLVLLAGGWMLTRRNRRLLLLSCQPGVKTEKG